MSNPTLLAASLPRRAFLQAVALGAAGVALRDSRAAVASDPKTEVGQTGLSAARSTSVSEFKIEEPMQGAVMHHRLGRVLPKGLEIEVSGIAPAGAQVLVQGRPAARDGERFRGTALLSSRETEIVATTQDRSAQRVRVLWDRHSRKRYRCVIDDNSFFLRDITQKGYASLFDCFYLKMLRDLHTRFGAKFTLNLYYTTADEWNLSQFPAQYRGEWNDHADWLRLAFHAYANEPAWPYEDAPVEKLLADLDLVSAQILRFAGPKVYSPPVVIHFGMTRPEAWKPLYQRGARVLGGYFSRSAPTGKWTVNYRLDDARSEWLSRHDAIKDFPSGIIFSKVDIVVNSTPLEKIVPTLEPVVADPRQGEIVDVLTHEQYFWPFYERYLPDHPQRLERAIEFLTHLGYQPVFLQDGFLGGPA
ncbi:MAG: hypothetical protein HZA90_13660 [Verrucomicrobia bacterium]|nr:hypothetical protein [Verrucomicrobiota bacterium]